MNKKGLLSVLLAFSVLFFAQTSLAGIGAKFPIATTTGRELALNAAFDGTNYLIGIQGDAADDTNVTAQLVSTSGSLVGERISTGAQGGAPIIAFDGTNYLMVWAEDSKYIYGQFVSKSGAMVGSAFTIATDTQMELGGGVVFDGTNYFIVWEDRSSSTANVYGQFVSQTGDVVGSKLAIISGKSRQPTLSFDGVRYLVVWHSQNNGSPGLWDVNGRFVSKAGTLSSVFAISQTPTPSYNRSSAAFDGTNFLVVWNHDLGSGGSNPTIWDIHGRLVSPAGSFPSSEFVVTSAQGSQAFPTVAFDGTNYLVIWTDERNDTNHNYICDSGEGSCWDIYGQYVDKSGSLVGSEILINEDPGNQLALLTCSGGIPLVLVNSLDNIASWSVGNVYGMFITKYPNPPANFSATSISGNTVKLTWKDNSSDETAFQLYKKVRAGTWNLLTTTGPGAVSFSDTDATGNTSSTSYSYYIKVCKNTNCSPSSQIATVPFKPINLKANVVSSSQINLSWSDSSGNETGFQIYRKDGGCTATNAWSLIASKGQNITSFNNTALTSGTYSYRMRSYKRSAAVPYSFGYSLWSNCAQANAQ